MMISKIASGDFDSRFVKLFVAANWLLTAVAVCVAAFVASPEMAAGILAGGVIANLNCMGLDRDCRRTVRWGSIAAYFGGMAVRMGLIALAVTALMIVFPGVFSPIGLIIGISVGVVNFYILVFAMLIYRFRVKEAL